MQITSDEEIIGYYLSNGDGTGSLGLLGGQQTYNVKSPLLPIASSLQDCIFNWAELAYPQLLSPAGATSSTFPPYYYRYYKNTGVYLAVSLTDDNVYVLGGLF